MNPLNVLRRSGLLLSLVTLLVAGFTLNNANRGPQDSNWERIQAERVIRVGIDPTIPPFGIYADPVPQGIDPGLAQLIADNLGLHVQFSLLTFDGAYDALLLGHVDMVVAALRPDPRWQDRIRYTQAYFDAGQILVSRDHAQSLDDLRGKTLAVETASEGDWLLKDEQRVTLIRYITAREAVTAAANGEADAALIDSITAWQVLSKPGTTTGLDLAESTLIPDPYVIALRRTDWRLYRGVNGVLDTLQRNGELTSLIAAWIAGSP